MERRGLSPSGIVDDAFSRVGIRVLRASAQFFSQEQVVDFGFAQSRLECCTVEVGEASAMRLTSYVSEQGDVVLFQRG